MSAADLPPSDNMSPVRLAVVGGGVTGLAAAFRLAELRSQSDSNTQITLFEGANRFGGIFGSEQIGDYLIERGADSFITNRGAAMSLCRRLEFESELIPTQAQYRRSLILRQGIPMETPAGFNLLAPTRLWPILTSPLLSMGGKWEIFSELWRQPRAKNLNDDESIATFARRHFGEEALQRLIQPLVGGIYTSDPSQISIRATLPRFVALEQEHGSLILGLRRQMKELKEGPDSASGARFGLFTAPRLGMQQLLDALEQRLAPETDLRRATPVRGLVRNGVRWKLKTPTGEEEFDGVILALSAPRAADVLDSIDTGCARALRSIEHASSAIVVTGHSLADVPHPLNAFGLVIPHIEGRRILAVSFLSRKFPGRAPDGKVILRTFIGGAMQPGEYHRSDEAIVTTVLAELQSIFGIRKDPEFLVLTRYHEAMPQYSIGHLDRVSQILRLAGDLPGVRLAGNYLNGVGIPDCIESGERAAESLWNQWATR